MPRPKTFPTDTGVTETVPRADTRVQISDE